MVAIYVLKLVRGKYYVGLTRRNIDRILDHLDGDGAAWTKKYPPVERKPILSFKEGLKESDEDKITLEMMQKYGINNVRGGKWCRIKMPSSHYEEIEKKLKNNNKKNANSKKTISCGRCGRSGHNRTYCKLKTTVDGVRITTRNWQFRPLQKKKKKSTKKTKGGFCIRCRDRKDFNLDRPFCIDCYNIMRDEYDDFYEDYCHSCGSLSNSTLEKPICKKCWSKM